MGQALWRAGDTGDALQVSRKGVLILEELSRADPNNATLREYLAETYGLMQPVLEKQGDLDESLEYAGKAQEIFSKLASADPANQLANANVGFSEIGIARVLVRKGRSPEAMVHVERAMKSFEANQHKSPYEIAGKAESYFTLGSAYEALAQQSSSSLRKAAYLRTARAWLRESVDSWQLDAHHGSPDPMGGHDGDEAREELSKCEAMLAQPNK